MTEPLYRRVRNKDREAYHTNPECQMLKGMPVQEVPENERDDCRVCKICSGEWERNKPTVEQFSIYSTLVRLGKEND